MFIMPTIRSHTPIWGPFCFLLVPLRCISETSSLDNECTKIKDLDIKNLLWNRIYNFPRPESDLICSNWQCYTAGNKTQPLAACLPGNNKWLQLRLLLGLNRQPSCPIEIQRQSQHFLPKTWTKQHQYTPLYINISCRYKTLGYKKLEQVIQGLRARGMQVNLHLHWKFCSPKLQTILSFPTFWRNNCSNLFLCK